MFNRPPETYAPSDDAVDAVSRDPANPLHQTALRIPPRSLVLDVGAGNGLLGRVVQRLNDTVVIDGVEPNDAGSAIARRHYRSFHAGYAEEFLRLHPERRYDYFVLNDVIEHLVDPVALLRDLRVAGGPECRLLISTPNVAYMGMRLHLLEGQFEYVDSGILERTHLRFFTLPTALQVFQQAGFHAAQVVLMQRPIRETEFRRHSRRRNVLSVARIRRDRTAHAYQFLFLLEQRPSRMTTVAVGRKDNLLRLLVKP